MDAYQMFVCFLHLVWWLPRQANTSEKVSCNTSRYELCVEPLKPLLHRPSEFVILPVFDDSELDVICSSPIKDCISSSTEECNYVDNALIDGTVAGVEFICSKDALNSYRQYRYCYSSREVILAAGRCMDSYNNHVSRLLNVSSQMDERKKNLCGLMNQLLRCLYTSTEEECGQAAASWIYETKMIMMTPTMDKIGCNSGFLYLDASFIFGIIMGLVTAIILLIIVIVCYRRRRSKSFRTQMSRRLGAPKTSLLLRESGSSAQPANKLLKPSLTQKGDIVKVVPDSSVENKSRSKCDETPTHNGTETNCLLNKDL